MQNSEIGALLNTDAMRDCIAREALQEKRLRGLGWGIEYTPWESGVL